jgi:transcriptional regulator of arginine metabolism
VPVNKHIRQQRIRELIQQEGIGNQHDLLGLLRESGIKVAQATLSRDCAELGIVRSKTHAGYRLLLGEDSTGRIIKGLVGMEVTSVAANETSVIVRTLPGRAHGVGSWLDQFKSPLILGTIAGDDTVLVIPDSVQNISVLMSYIQKNLSTN